MSEFESISEHVKNKRIDPKLVKKYICEFNSFDSCQFLPTAPSHFPTLVDSNSRPINCLDQLTLRETSSPDPPDRSDTGRGGAWTGYGGKRLPRITRSARLFVPSSPRSTDSQLFDNSYSYTQDTSGIEPSFQKPIDYSDSLLDSEVDTQSQMNTQMSPVNTQMSQMVTQRSQINSQMSQLNTQRSQVNRQVSSQIDSKVSIPFRNLRSSRRGT